MNPNPDPPIRIPSTDSVGSGMFSIFERRYLQRTSLGLALPAPIGFLVWYLEPNFHTAGVILFALVGGAIFYLCLALFDPDGVPSIAPPSRLTGLLFKVAAIGHAAGAIKLSHYFYNLPDDYSL